MVAGIRGVSYPVLEQPSRELPHCEAMWMTSMRAFLNTTNSSIQLDEPCVPPRQRDGDEYIMDLILAANHYSNAEIRKLNYCRLFINAITVADLAMPCGKMLDMEKAQGRPGQHSSISSHLAIHQAAPSANEWRLWRRALLLWSNIHGVLRQPLGKWVVSLENQRQRHVAYIYQNRLWIRRTEVGFVYNEYLRYEVDEGFHACNTTRPFSTIPSGSLPVTVLRDDNHDVWYPTNDIRLDHRYVPVALPSTARTFTEYAKALPPWEAELLQYTEFTTDPYEFCVDLQPHLRAVSDGSVRHDTQGAFGWSMRNEFGATVATGMGPARGGGSVTSYRAEAYGLLSILRFLIRMAEFAEMRMPWNGIVATDSQSVLYTLFGHDELRRERERDRDEPINLSGSTVILNCLSPDWDVLIEIQHALSQLPNIELTYVRGHQDRNRSYHELDEMGQLNVDADAKAREYQDAHGAARPLVLLSTNAHAHILGPQGTATGHYSEYLRYQATATPLKEYILKKYAWSEQTMDSINWEAHRKALGKLFKRRAHFTKLVFDILPTNSQLNKFDNGKRTCPTCTCSIEDRDHIIRCLARRRVNWHLEFMASLEDFCRTTKTDSDIQTLLRVGFEQWFSTEGTTLSLQKQQFSPQLWNIIDQQNVIGWRQMFNGRFSKEWSRVQQAAYDRRPRTAHGQIKQTGDRWQIKLIAHIWTQWEKAWEDRNNAVHGQTASEKSTAIRKEVRRQLDVIYTNRHLMEPSVQELLYDRPEDHDRQYTTTTRNWLAQNAQLFKDSIKRATRRAIHNVRSIRTYFQAATGD